MRHLSCGRSWPLAAASMPRLFTGTSRRNGIGAALAAGLFMPASGTAIGAGGLGWMATPARDPFEAARKQHLQRWMLMQGKGWSLVSGSAPPQQHQQHHQQQVHGQRQSGDGAQSMCSRPGPCDLPSPRFRHSALMRMTVVTPYLPRGPQQGRTLRPQSLEPQPLGAKKKNRYRPSSELRPRNEWDRTKTHKLRTRTTQTVTMLTSRFLRKQILTPSNATSGDFNGGGSGRWHGWRNRSWRLQRSTMKSLGTKPRWSNCRPRRTLPSQSCARQIPSWPKCHRRSPYSQLSELVSLPLFPPLAGYRVQHRRHGC